MVWRGSCLVLENYFFSVIILKDLYEGIIICDFVIFKFLKYVFNIISSILF